jgi:FkbM family methyltransferase
VVVKIDQGTHLFKKLVHRMFNLLGLEVTKYKPLDDFGILRREILRSVTHVLDIGANSGQWGLEVRKDGWDGHLYSFEPISEFFTKLQQNGRFDQNWKSFNFALGNECGEFDIYIAGNDGGSSSFFEIDQFVIDLQANTETIGIEKCRVKRLDCLNLFSENDSVYLKADVQGYEFQILHGCSGIEHLINGIELEVSFVELYKSQVLIEDVVKKVRTMGLVPVQIRKGFTNKNNGTLLQIDLLFSRPLNVASK